MSANPSVLQWSVRASLLSHVLSSVLGAFRAAGVKQFTEAAPALSLGVLCPGWGDTRQEQERLRTSRPEPGREK